MLILAIYVANDATEFGQNGMLWAIIVLFMPMMGLVIYLVVRSGWTRSTSSTSTNEYRYQPQREQVRPVSSNQMNSKRSNNIKASPMTQFCTSCGYENIAEASFCNSCGSEIGSVGR